MKISRNYLFGLLAATLILITVGCGDGTADDFPQKLGKVTGVVKMNGEPLAGATITFQPTKAKSGKSAYGVTDKEGKYTLLYSAGHPGAVVGKNQVSIYIQSTKDGDDTFVNPVPAKYNTAAAVTPEMNVEVKAEDQTFDFNLTK